jgi:hypothetical protein
LALIILVTGGVVCMAVVSLLKLEQFFFEQGTNINSIRKRMTPIFVFTSSVIIRASWLQLAISFHFFFSSQILLENALNEGNPFFLILEEAMCLATIWFFLHLFCLFVYLFEQSATYFHGLDGTIHISKQTLDTFSFYLLLYVASAHCPASGIHFSVVLHVNTKKMFCRHFSLILYANDCKNENSFPFYHSGYVNIF